MTPPDTSAEAVAALIKLVHQHFAFPTNKDHPNYALREMADTLAAVVKERDEALQARNRLIDFINPIIDEFGGIDISGTEVFVDGVGGVEATEYVKQFIAHRDTASRQRAEAKAALAHAASTFRWYADLHRAKGDDPANVEKIRRNEEEALKCERALLSGETK